LKLFWQSWRSVPERYRDVRLKTLAPSTAIRMPLAAQAAMIAIVKANLHKSMILYGPAKTGKTHLALAIYRDACADSAIRLCRSTGEGGFATWRVNTSVWLEDVIRWETRDKKDDSIDPPAFSEKSIESAAKAGVRPRVFLEEIDKFKVSELQAHSTLRDRQCDLRGEGADRGHLEHLGRGAGGRVGREVWRDHPAADRRRA
jgi:hypothetical protein